MPTITRSAAKRHRQTEKRTIINKNTKAYIDFLVKKACQAMATKDKTQSLEAIKKAVSVIDKAVQKKILKKNTAARKKTQLFIKLGKT